LRIGAKLCYDNSTDQDFKPVDYLKQEPMTYKVFITHDKVTLEFRALCLSSQHEDSCFRIKISVASVDISAGPLEVTSDPIRVVSKASQVQREKRNSKRTPNENEIDSSPSSPLPTKLSGNKRSSPSSISNDFIVQETLQRLEQQQIEQRIMIEQILATQQQTPILLPPQQPPQDFETAFSNFLNAYRNLPCEDRPNKVRKVINDSAAVNPADLSAV